QGDIGASGNPVLITLDLNGDARTRVPLVSKGNLYLTGYNAVNPGGHPTTDPRSNHGYGVYLVSGGSNGLSLTSGVNTSGFLVGSRPGSIYLVSTGGGSLSQSGGVLGTASLTMLSTKGDIGSFL